MEVDFGRKLMREIVEAREAEYRGVIRENFESFVKYAKQEMGKYYDWAVSEDYDEELAREKFELASSAIRVYLDAMKPRIARMEKLIENAMFYKYFDDDDNMKYFSEYMSKNNNQED